MSATIRLVATLASAAAASATPHAAQPWGLSKPTTAFGAGHLRVMTFYGMDPALQHGWTNVYRGSIGDCDNTTLTGTYKMKILVDLPDTVFDRDKKAVHPKWRAAVSRFTSSLMPKLAASTALGVFLGDEICCGGTPYSNLSSVALALRKDLGAKAWLYTNECSEMAKWPSLADGGVPSALDAISVEYIRIPAVNSSSKIPAVHPLCHAASTTSTTRTGRRRSTRTRSSTVCCSSC